MTVSALETMVGEWITVASSDAIDPGYPLAVEFGGEEVLLYRVDGLLYATHGACTHTYASLAGGYLDGYEIECPIHQGRFDVRTGRATREPCEEPLRAYRVREVDGAVQLSNTPF